MDQDTPSPGWNPNTSETTDTGKSSATTSTIGVTSATESGICPHCGQSMNRGLEQFLNQIGINDEMINNLKTQFQNVDLDDYLDTARIYLKESSTKATVYAKENPGKVAAGVAALALGAGLIYAATRDR